MSGWTPTDVANQSLDCIGADFQLGDIEEGTDAARKILRAYRQCLMQLTRAAHWDFCRKEAPLVLLADSTGNTANVGTMVSNRQFCYAYQYPIDAMKVRFIPGNHQQNPGAPPGNIVPPNPASPLTTGQGQAPLSGRSPRPAKFNVGLEYNYPPPPGQITWEVQGVSPAGRTVIFTNVKHACAVYTALVLYPSVWDPQFRAALVAYIAQEVALAVLKDKKFALQVRTQQMQITKEKVLAARATDGNEGFFSNDLRVDWIDTRITGGGPNSGWGYGGNYGGDGCFGGYDSIGFADGTAV